MSFPKWPLKLLLLTFKCLVSESITAIWTFHLKHASCLIINASVFGCMHVHLCDRVYFGWVYSGYPFSTKVSEKEMGVVFIQRAGNPCAASSVYSSDNMNWSEHRRFSCEELSQKDSWNKGMEAQPSFSLLIDFLRHSSPPTLPPNWASP